MATVYQSLDPGAAQFLSTSYPAMVRNGTNFPVYGLAFDAVSDEAAFWLIRAVNYGSGNLTVNLDWYADTASSGDVVWSVQIAAITADTDTQDVETKSLATANTVTDTHLGTTAQRLHRASVTVSNLDSLAANDDVWIRISRDADNAADTMTGDAILVLATVTYSDA
ncbi:hypothetical protein C8D88_116139 [Lentzea atacamensis]|uniref:Uncharacterized protein n=1 Tax=Lentzea atacamensis TaxID=531938 RepID=A0A316HNV8_9PSEU|nr:hypothetical protein [Lentzea atacamensis]PWK81727.1 hypothetical protein C8D88_116139 [Lentzea atacamensis]